MNNRALVLYGQAIALAVAFRKMAAAERNAAWRRMTRDMMRTAAKNAIYHRGRVLP